MKFDSINHLLFKQTKNIGDIIDDFSPYLTSRMFSFYKKGIFSDYINDTLNVYSNVFSSKEEQLKFFDNLIPKLKIERIKYIKKTENKKPKENTEIPEFLSKREIDMMEKLHNYLYE